MLVLFGSPQLLLPAVSDLGIGENADVRGLVDAVASAHLPKLLQKPITPELGSSKRTACVPRCRRGGQIRWSVCAVAALGYGCPQAALQAAAVW